MRLPEGILLVDKPKGITSFDVIRKLRKRLDIRKMGHAGTLDPLASGLMIIGIGKATKNLSVYLKLDKTYDVEITIGVQTDTGDREGEIIEEKVVTDLDISAVDSVLAALVGTQRLPVPKYSAIKQNGQRLYKKARAGECFSPPVKAMKINNIKSYDISYENKHSHLHVRMDVGSGTYVRSIAEEIGRRLGYPATVRELWRVKIGAFDITDAQSL